MICDDDPHLAETIASISPYVEEVRVTRPRDVPGATDAEGRMLDFSLARDASMANVSQPWVMWLDSDDVVSGADQLVELCKAPPGVCYLLPYEYAYDAVGRCTVRQYRERLFSPAHAMRWKFPVHEVCMPVGPALTMVQSDAVTVQHRRHTYTKPQEPNRNLRILTAWMAANPDDVRNQFYFGLELANANRLDEATEVLAKYVGSSGWLDEKATALFTLVSICERRRQYGKALDWAFEALKVCDWFESCYAIARQFYYLKNWERCMHYARMALNAPETKTVLFVDQSARDELHVYLNFALNQLGRTEEAYESTLAGLKGNPSHLFLRNNAAEYAKALGKTSGEGAPRHEPARGPEEAGTIPGSSPHIPGSSLDIVFVTASWERWDPESIKATGIGGSEIMLAAMARELAKLGHKVTVYADPTKEGTYDGAQWKNKERFRDITCDVLVVSRQAAFLREDAHVSARVRLLWCHDVCAIGATHELLARADRVLALSEWHKGNLLAAHAAQGLTPEKVLVTRNGIDLDRFKAAPPSNAATPVARNPYKIVNSSSPDRSWPVLLELFPRIRERVPQAELHLFYGFENMRKDPQYAEMITQLERQMQQPGVTFHGRVSQEELAQEFLSAGLWAYPTWFSETSCISAMEAQAAGLHIVTSDIAALKETIGTHGVLLPGDWRSRDYQDAFVNVCVEMLGRPKPADRAHAERFSLSSLALEWQTMMRELLAEKNDAHPLKPYEPTTPYRKKPVPKVKLNIACGPNIFPHDGWTNYDKVVDARYWAFLQTGERHEMPEHQRTLAKWMKGRETPVFEHDMTERFPHEDGSVDYIYVGQAIEHLNRRTQVIPFLQECRRMLKPGGTLRMTTPDLAALVNEAHQVGGLDKFAGDQPEWFKTATGGDKFAYLAFGAAGPECTQNRYEGHFHLYTRESMKAALEEAGFTTMVFDAPPMGEVVDAGMSHSFSVEATR